MPVSQLFFPPEDFLSATEVEIVGHVTNDGALLAGSEPRERFDLATEFMQVGDVRFTSPVGIRATLFANESDERELKHPAASSFPPLAYGDRVRMTARLRLPRNFGNPAAFDYEGYLHGLGITALASVRADRVEILPGQSGTRLGFWRSRIRRSILAHIHNPKLWSEEDAALFAAMTVGDDSLLLRYVREEFQETGVYHLLVVSGMNVGLLAFALFWLARRLRASQWIASGITIVLSIFYAFVAGMGVPIMRAVLMLSLYLVGRLLYRNRAPLNAAGFAAIGVLVFSPMAWFDPAFQLTFLALLAIAGISVPILERTLTPYRRSLRMLDVTNYDLTLEPPMAQFRIDVRMVAGRIAQYLGRVPARWLVVGCLHAVFAFCELLTVSSITQAVLVLPMRMYFHRAAFMGLPVNLMVLPLAGVLLNGAVIAIFLSYIWSPAARVAGWVAARALHWTLFFISTASHWKFAQWRVPDANVSLFLLAALGVLQALAAVHRRGATAVAGIALLFLSAGVVALHRPAAHVEPAKLEITAIDVGQGDSLLLVSPEGRTMLIDAGGAIGRSRGEFDYGEDVVSPYLWWRGLDHLDVVVLTLARADHIGGLPRVIENFHPKELWLGSNPQTLAMRRLRSMALDNHVQMQRRTAGEEFDWAGVHIQVLSPPQEWVAQRKPIGDDSLTLLVGYGATKMLLAGEVEKEMESFVSGSEIGADVLKVPHHGSNSSTSEDLLDAVHPRFAVISVGAQNPYGDPHPDVLERLQESGAVTYRTDTMGAVTFLLDGNKIETRVALQPKTAAP